MIVLLVFVLIALISGVTLGFLTVRGILPLDFLDPNGDFKWTDFSEGVAQTTGTDETAEDEKGEKPETSAPADDETELPPETETESAPPETTPPETIPPEETRPDTGDTPPESAPPEETLPETGDTPPESAPPEETLPTTGIDYHYLTFIGRDSVAIVDDKAHIWDKDTSTGIFGNAMSMAERSGYSIMIVASKDLFGMSMQDFAENYFKAQVEANHVDPERAGNGYLLLLDVYKNEYYFAAFGRANDYYYGMALYDLFEELDRFMAEADYAGAANRVIEKTIY